MTSKPKRSTMSHLKTSIKLTCQKCGRVWKYKGKRKYYTSCPDCKTSVKVGKA